MSEMSNWMSQSVHSECLRIYKQLLCMCDVKNVQWTTNILEQMPGLSENTTSF